MQQSVVKFYCSVVQALLNVFRASQCPSSGACQTAVAASGFHMNVEVDVFSAVVQIHFPLRLDNGRSPHAYVNQRLQIQLRTPVDERCAARNMLSLQ